MLAFVESERSGLRLQRWQRILAISLLAAGVLLLSREIPAKAQVPINPDAPLSAIAPSSSESPTIEGGVPAPPYIANRTMQIVSGTAEAGYFSCSGGNGPVKKTGLSAGHCFKASPDPNAWLNPGKVINFGPDGTRYESPINAVQFIDPDIAVISTLNDIHGVDFPAVPLQTIQPTQMYGEVVSMAGLGPATGGPIPTYPRYAEYQTAPFKCYDSTEYPQPFRENGPDSMINLNGKTNGSNAGDSGANLHQWVLNSETGLDELRTVGVHVSKCESLTIAAAFDEIRTAAIEKVIAQMTKDLTPLQYTQLRFFVDNEAVPAKQTKPIQLLIFGSDSAEISVTLQNRTENFPTTPARVTASTVITGLTQSETACAQLVGETVVDKELTTTSTKLGLISVASNNCPLSPFEMQKNGVTATVTLTKTAEAGSSIQDLFASKVIPVEVVQVKPLTLARKNYPKDLLVFQHTITIPDSPYNGAQISSWMLGGNLHFTVEAPQSADFIFVSFEGKNYQVPLAQQTAATGENYLAGSLAIGADTEKTEVYLPVIQK